MSRSPTTTLMAPTPSPVSVFDADGDELDAANAKEDIVQVVKSYYDQQYRQAADHAAAAVREQGDGDDVDEEYQQHQSLALIQAGGERSHQRNAGRQVGQCYGGVQGRVQ